MGWMIYEASLYGTVFFFFFFGVDLRFQGEFGKFAACFKVGWPAGTFSTGTFETWFLKGVWIRISGGG